VTARRGTLAGRIALVTTAVAVVAVLVAGLVSLGLVRSAGDADARKTLSALADAAADGSGGTGRLGDGPALARQRTRNQLNGLKIDFTFLTRAGKTSGGPADGLASRALTGPERQAVVAGRSLSLTRDVGGVRTLVEARPAAIGGVVLAQSLSDASFARDAVQRIALSLLVGLAVAALAGLLLARLLARPLKRAAQTAHRLAAGARDVRVPPEGPAEVAEVADSLNALSAALATSEGRQREFLLSVSHELRTPLTAITGFAESLADGVTTGPDVQPVARTVLGEAHRLERLVSDLLDLARLGAQDFRIDLQPVDLTALMQTAGAVWRSRCEAVGVTGLTDLPPHPVLCVTDATRVRQIVDGLAENALRVTPAGRPVLLGLYELPAGAPATAVLQVRDGGPGLSPADLPVAFERSVLYQRYRGVRQVGTGVGLALVHGLTVRLGGSADAGRAPEGGACFTVRLPLRPAATGGRMVTVPPPDRAGRPGPDGGGSVPAPRGR
jgi:two-component system OmpR family sensor kinase